MEYAITKDVSGCENKVKQFSLRITEICNRDCSYCHYHSEINYDLNDIIKIIDQILLFVKLDNSIPLFYFHGGEPTSHKNIEYILEYIRKQCPNAIIEFQTNFDNQDIIFELLPLIDRLNISFHFPDKHIDKKLKKIKNIKNIYPRILNTIDLIYIPGYDRIFKKLRLFFNALKINNEITYSFFHASNYEKDIKNLGIRLTQTELIKNKYFRGEMETKNIICDTSNYCIINGNGDIFKCSYALTVNESSGNIIKDKNALSNAMSKIKCPYSYCGCEQSYLGKIK